MAAAGGFALWQSVENGQPNRDLNVKEVAARSQCNNHVPTCPPSRQGKKEQHVKGNGKAELMTNSQTSINTGKHASADHSY
jgi:hypothetical protein